MRYLSSYNVAQDNEVMRHRNTEVSINFNLIQEMLLFIKKYRIENLNAVVNAIIPVLLGKCDSVDRLTGFDLQ